MTLTLRFLLTTLFVLTGSAFADTFQFDNAGSVVWDNVFVNPYTAHQTVLTSSGYQEIGGALTIYCDDWNTDFSGTPAWNASVYALNSSNLSNLKYGSDTTQTYNLTLSANVISATASNNNPDPLDRYLEAAYLDSLWQAELLKASPSTAVQQELAAAAWTLFVDPNHVAGLINAINDTTNPSGFATAVYDDVQDANTAVTSNGFTGQGWEVITPTSNSFPMQEFLVYTPEPGALILFGTVIAILGGTIRRKIRRQPVS